MDTHSFRGLVNMIVTSFFFVTAIILDDAAGHLRGTLFHASAALAGIWTMLTVIMFFVTLRQGLLAWRAGEWAFKPASFTENKSVLLNQHDSTDLEDLF